VPVLASSAEKWSVVDPNGEVQTAFRNPRTGMFTGGHRSSANDNIREQLMDVALQVAGFTYAQGDSFRRVLKHPKHPAERTFHDNFSTGAVDNGYSRSDAEELYQHIAKFGGAYFNKSHAIAYGMIVYQLM